MFEGITVSFRGAGKKEPSVDLFTCKNEVTSALAIHAEGFDGQSLVPGRARGARKVVAAVERANIRYRFDHVVFPNGKVRVRFVVRQVAATARAEVVQNGDAVSLAKEPRDKVRADEARAARHKRVH
jgi:hypothetical protein